MELKTILKEADKEFDDLWKHWIYLSEIKTGVNFNSFKNGIKSVFKYQITKAYKAGEKNKNAKYDYFKDGYLTGREQTIKQIEEGLPKKIHYYE